jgi:hypothetical protein
MVEHWFMFHADQFEQIVRIDFPNQEIGESIYHLSIGTQRANEFHLFTMEADPPLCLLLGLDVRRLVCSHAG